MEDQKIICERCGVVSFIAPDKRRRKDNLCSSCRARPAKSISYGWTKPCKPHHGEFDIDDNPLQNGRIFMPGKRICGHSDCIEITHCHTGEVN